MTAIRSLFRILANPWFLAVAVVAIAVAADFVRLGTLQMWCFLIINIMLAQSINLLTGVTGQISLGHAGFYAVGAYAGALAITSWGVPFPLNIIVATLVAALVGLGVSIPAGRVREFYLAMMTLAFGLIVYELARELRGLTGGVMGFRGIPSPQLNTMEIFGWRVDQVWYFRFMLGTLVLMMFMLRNFVKSHYGRAFYAVHVSEVGAGSLGISAAFVKRFAYTVSAGMAGMAGGFYAHMAGFIGPSGFELMRSVEILVMSIVGGFGSLVGQVMGAALFTYLPEYLQAFSQYQFMVYGLILVFSFTLLPKGIAGMLSLSTRYNKSEMLGQQVVSSNDVPLLTPRQSARSAQRSVGAAAVADHSRPDPVLEASDIVMQFGGLRALDGVSIALQPGQVTGLVGPNGSGKSTLVNVISGVYRPTSGRVMFQETDIGHWRADKVSRIGVTRTFQDPRNVPNFTVRENVLMGAHRLYRHGALSAALNLRHGLAEEATFLARADRIIEFAGLAEYAEEVMSELPYGIQRMAEVARSLLSDPALLLLDEPAAGLSENETENLNVMIRLARDNGVAVMLIDHHMDFLDKLVDDVVVLDVGRVIYRGDMVGMRANPDVIAAYLGAEEDEHA